MIYSNIFYQLNCFKAVFDNKAVQQATYNLIDLKPSKIDETKERVKNLLKQIDPLLMNAPRTTSKNRFYRLCADLFFSIRRSLISTIALDLLKKTYSVLEKVPSTDSTPDLSEAAVLARAIVRNTTRELTFPIPL